MTATVAGCTVLGGDTKLIGDTSEEDSSVLTFTDDGETVLKIQLVKQFSDDEFREYFPFFIASWQPDGIRIDSLELRFRSIPRSSSGFTPAGISLREGAHAHMATLSRVDGHPSTTVIDLPDTTAIGDGSVRIDLLLKGDPLQEPQELWIQAKATLSSDGTFGEAYEVRGDYTVKFPS